jgi:radical SAM superfamily enzyme YgiQ (UPF0313 family)
MKVLLVKPRPDAVQFGLAPFFQTEPLGLEYIASELEHRGHAVATVDLRFDRRRFRDILRRERPAVVGIACLHLLDAPATLRLAGEIKAADPAVFVAVGGHAASSYPQAVSGSQAIDAICLGEGEHAMPTLVDAIERREPVEEVPSLLVRTGDGFVPTTPALGFLDLAAVRLPDRRQVAPYQRHYCCLNYMPVWTLETTRGCPHRCKFCSVWQFYRGSCRFHAPGPVRADFEAAGHNIFVIDDIFWAERAQSEELAGALLASRERKNWMLVQSRVDLVAENAALLERWRPLARNFDIFFGFESPTASGLDRLNKGTDVATTAAAIRTARELGYGVTGNFIIDPDFSEDDFRSLWDFLAAHQLNRVGFTILTPLPGTHYFEKVKDQLLVFDWSQYDLHHLLWRPRLAPERFFELYCETWRRSVLNLAGNKRIGKWLREVHPLQIPRLIRILWRTQKLMQPKAYLAESRIPAGE